ncbi:MAG: hypothetical protein ACAH07_01030 [Methylophilaceae bacterium]|jgi:hypothetical protein
MTTSKDTDHDKQQTPSKPPKGEGPDAFTNGASKKSYPETDHSKPQADQALNPDLSSENDI